MLEDALSARDLGAIKHEAHALKGSAEQCGMIGLAMARALRADADPARPQPPRARAAAAPAPIPRVLHLLGRVAAGSRVSPLPCALPTSHRAAAPARARAQAAYELETSCAPGAWTDTIPGATADVLRHIAQAVELQAQLQTLQVSDRTKAVVECDGYWEALAINTARAAAEARGRPRMWLVAPAPAPPNISHLLNGCSPSEARAAVAPEKRLRVRPRRASSPPPPPPPPRAGQAVRRQPLLARLLLPDQPASPPALEPHELRVARRQPPLGHQPRQQRRRAARLLRRQLARVPRPRTLTACM